MKYFLLLLLFLLVFTFPVAAESNNKFGIHLAQPYPQALDDAAKLVNSNGGKWGYVTLVIQEDDRDRGKWQEVFNKLRELHLIPIIRIATKPENGSWKRAYKEEAADWATFLNSLLWVTKERYVILFNEPNHATEWGESVNAVDYANVSLEFAKKLKQANNDFYVMLAGLDASAPYEPPSYLDEGDFLEAVINTIGADTFNDYFSGLASHSYPNPGFTGSAEGSGKGSVRTYEWELDYLKSLGVKELPVFITETGWDGDALSRDAVAQNFQTAFEDVWLPDKRVRAVTPFVLDYQGAPFTNFSWKKLGSEEFYPQYYKVQSMSKEMGDPVVIERGKIRYQLGDELVTGSTYRIPIELQNLGQAIWDKDDGYKLVISGLAEGNYLFADITDLKPLETNSIELFFKTRNITGKKTIQINLMKNDTLIIAGDPKTITIAPLPQLQFQLSLFPKAQVTGGNFEIQIFDQNEQLIFKKQGIQVEHGKGNIPEVSDIALHKQYRVVLLHDYYLPRQMYVTFNKGVNRVSFRIMLPFDLNRDGHFDWQDIWTAISNPGRLSLFRPGK